MITLLFRVPDLYSRISSHPMLEPAAQATRRHEEEFEDCFSCKLIGTAALGAVGIYALNQSCAHQPGSVMGKRIMASIGICMS